MSKSSPARANQSPVGRAKRVALIDSDTILFATASVAEMCVKGGGLDGEDQWIPTMTLTQAYNQVVSGFDRIVEAVKADDAIICLSDRANFRYGILPSYKSNRKESRRPPMLAKLRDALQKHKPFPVLLVKGLEADDLCGICAGTISAAGKKPIVCSEDKDLKTIPGSLFQKGKLVDISPADADRNWFYQVLTGDSTDGYKGCPNVGPVKALKILAEIEGKSPTERWSRIVVEYLSRGASYDDALTQARVARILRSTDWDPNNKDVILWQPPTIPAELMRPPQPLTGESTT